MVKLELIVGRIIVSGLHSAIKNVFSSIKSLKITASKKIIQLYNPLQNHAGNPFSKNDFQRTKLSKE